MTNEFLNQFAKDITLEYLRVHQEILGNEEDNIDSISAKVADIAIEFRTALRRNNKLDNAF